MIDTTSPDFWPDLFDVLLLGTGQTLYMVFFALVFTVLIGLPVGILLVGTERGGLFEKPFGSRTFGRILNRVLDFVVNLGRSVPFIILMIAIIPFTRLVVGTTLGPTAAVVPLSVGAIPFFARLVETSLREIQRGKVEAAVVQGASYGQIIRKVLIPESLPGVVSGLTNSVIALISYSAMAGTIGGGGLGFLAKSRGYDRFQGDIMLVTVIVIVIIVQIVQVVGDRVSRSLDHR